ncbi:hypothetical protein NP493_321g03022 [Ridgeia piscesae]|uniref:Uncharacterized protein n=1 Tax=Ridgeia piscesae TaxID=27915 RepID=A0AAD9L6B2_RIDPI|nr:hypothetical protein NP493_321g03022 [Ridgeia piscesae]
MANLTPDDKDAKRRTISQGDKGVPSPGYPLSVLPSKRRANPDRRADVNMKVKEACNEVDVKFVDNDANFTFRNGAADDAAFQRDGLHLSESGVGRLLLNLSLQEQPPETLQTPTSITTSTRVKRNEPRPIAERKSGT